MKNHINLIQNKTSNILLLIIMIFIIFRLFAYFETEYVVIWFDSAQFAATSFAPVWSGLFWSDGIPPLYPFFLKYFLTVSNDTAHIGNEIFSIFSSGPVIIKGIEILDDYPYFLVKDNFDVVSASLFQLLFSITSCIVLALSISSTFKNTYIKLISTTIILIFGMESSISLWDKHILTESISISLLFLLISFLVHINKVASNFIYLTSFILALIFYSFIKITNNYLIILLTPYIAYHLLKNNYNYKLNYSFIVFTLLSLFIFNQYMLYKGDRSHVPMKDIISSRISSDGFEDVYSYFKAAGMPELPVEVTGKLWTANFEHYPELHDWWLTKSSMTYQKFLITHPAYFFFRPFQYTNDFNKPVYDYLTPDLHFHEQVVPNKLQIIFTDAFLWLAFSGLLILSLYLIINNIKIMDLNNIMLPLFILVSGIILYLIIWHADLGELDRHLIQCAIMIRIALLMALMTLINSLFIRDKTI